MDSRLRGDDKGIAGGDEDLNPGFLLVQEWQAGLHHYDAR